MQRLVFGGRQIQLENDRTLADCNFQRNSSIYLAADADQHKKVAKIADEILSIDAKDGDAFRCKVVATMQQGQHDAALALIAKSKEHGPGMAFEKAYCLYRSGKIEEAFAVAGAGEAVQPEACLQLQAQLAHRLNRSSEAVSAYERLAKGHAGALTLEVKTNIVASYVAAELSSEVPGLMKRLGVTTKDGFELGFNRAVSLSALGEFAKAEHELRLALKLGRETLFEEEMSAEEVAEELAPLTVQLGYVLSRLGRADDALVAYESVLLQGAGGDAVVRCVAQNNCLAESGKIDPGASNKKAVANAAKALDALLDKGLDKGPSGGHALRLSAALDTRLSIGQKSALHLNRALLYLLSGRLDPAREAAAAIGKAFGDSPSLTLLKAALLAADGKHAEADALLEAAAGGSSSGASPSASPPLQAQLMRSQLALEAGGTGAARALELLTAIREPAEVVFSGAMLSSRYALYTQLGDTAGAEALLDGAHAHWSSKAAAAGAERDAALGWCLQALVGLKLKLGKVSEAVKCFQALQTSGGGISSASASVLGRLMRALAVSDPAGALGMEKQLPAVSGAGIRGVDVDALEAGASRGSGGMRKKEGGRKRGGDAMDADKGPGGAEVKKKARRKHTPRFPKGYDPALPGGGVPPSDPERWLPKWQRSDFKRRKATSAMRKAGDVVKGSQGAGKVDAALDRSNAPPPTKEAAKPALPTRPSGKKGKGKK
ncbi:hypothetical protein FOA52_011360 [Chlamydomonas sp. UWO 241]|nr:hypothetical protein FOA52_011360 [Chlamydomonas sp. UWO 241]